LSALSPFSSLRALFLSHVFGRLFFGFNPDCQPIDLVDGLASLAKTTVLSYISRLAQSLTSLEGCFIYDNSQADKDEIWKRTFSFQGWLSIHNRNIDSEDSEELLVHISGAR
jgi:hypothetical protein